VHVRKGAAVHLDELPSTLEAACLFGADRVVVDAVGVDEFVYCGQVALVVDLFDEPA